MTTIHLDQPGYYVALVAILVLVALMTIYHKQIVDWLTPVTRWLHEWAWICCSVICILTTKHSSSLPVGWIVPIAVLFIISFPPVRLRFDALSGLTDAKKAFWTWNRRCSMWPCVGPVDWIWDCRRRYFLWWSGQLLVRTSWISQVAPRLTLAFAVLLSTVAEQEVKSLNALVYLTPVCPKWSRTVDSKLPWLRD